MSVEANLVSLVLRDSDVAASFRPLLESFDFQAGAKFSASPSSGVPPSLEFGDCVPESGLISYSDAQIVSYQNAGSGVCP